MQTLKGLTTSAIEKFVSENDGVVIDCAPGSFVDNIVYGFSFGTLFCFEQYFNEWSSGYICYFFNKSREKGINKKWDEFYALRDQSETA